MNKYSRTPPSFSSANETSEKELPQDHWYHEYIRNLEKCSVQSEQSYQTLYEQISSILGNSKSKYSTVDEAVADMKERTGLTAFLAAKTAQDQTTNLELPAIFKNLPEMKIFIDNFIADRPGTSVEAVVHDLMKINNVRHNLPDKTDVGDDVRKYINAKLIESKRNLPQADVNMNIGRVEPNSDADENAPFEFCEPHSD